MSAHSVGRGDSNGDPLRSWVRMQLMEVGHLAHVLQGGGGKLSTDPGDPGEPARKPAGGTA